MMEECEAVEHVAKALAKEALEELAGDTEHIRGRLADARYGLSDVQADALVDRVQDAIDRHRASLGI